MPSDSLCKVDGRCEYRLHLKERVSSDSGSRPSLGVAVIYRSCEIADSMHCGIPGEDIEVFLEGTLDSEGHFVATAAIGKCSHNYELRDDWLAEHTRLVPRCE
jgi:hypothetical protein